MVADKKEKPQRAKRAKLIGIGLWTQRTGHNPILLIMYQFCFDRIEIIAAAAAEYAMAGTVLRKEFCEIRL